VRIESVKSPGEANRALLLAALHPEPDRFVQLLQRHGNELDWDWLLDRGAAHKVEALLASRVEAAAAETHLPAHARAQLSAARRNAVARHQQGLSDLAQVDRCLSGARIPYLLLKGPALTQQVYDHAGQRHFFDLDLLTRPADVDAAQAALEGLGYRLWGGKRYLGFAPANADELACAMEATRASLKRFGHELSLITDDRSRVPIDLHWHLMPRRRITAASASTLWEHTTTLSVDGLTVRVLDTEATLLHLAMHAWSNRPWGFALLHLCDFAWALHRMPVDAGRLSKLAARWGGRADLDRALYATEHVLGLSLPADIDRKRAAKSPSARFRRMATAEHLLEHCTRPAKLRRLRWQQELDWGLAMDSLSSTAVLLVAKYTAVARYRANRWRRRRSPSNVDRPRHS
jgi:hypothetical protein